MTNQTTIIKDLKKFGLSENQAKIYLALTQYGESRIQTIVNIVHLPRTSVYDCLKTLSQFGLVEKIVGHKFVKIKPYPISHLRHGLEEKILKLKTLSSDITELEQAIKLLPNAKSFSSTIVRYYSGVTGARQLFYNTLNAKSMVNVYSAYGRSKFVGKKFYMNFVQESLEKNIKERVLINPTERALNFIKQDTGSSLARTKLNDLRFLPEENLTIKGETFIYDNIYAQINLSANGINGFEIESRSFTEMQRSIFETLWRLAKNVTEVL
jgi:sugar-specific transcriptional regulator TrmB